ncbi:MAG TPA: hypothetical protein VKY37_04530 [Brumimicrobium sp.]|nr:hypothetical protein [Brumimicrobium sp.]
MKLKTTLLLLTLGFIVLSENTSIAQDFTPNTLIIQPYVGVPNMKRWIYDTEYTEGNSSKGFGHVGLTGEVRISKRFGLGFDAIYSPFTRTENYSYSKYNQVTDTFDIISGSRVFKENKLRLIAKAYIHFNVKNPMWDLYLSGGVGANIVFAKAYKDGQQVNYQENFNSSNEGLILRNPFPFSGRICFGARYFFSDYIGVNFETGFGGPPFSCGLSVRL